jgi:hypothetical protein
MEPNCKTVHAREYMTPRSLEQRLCKKIVRLVEIDVLEEDYPSELSSEFSEYAIPKKNGIIRVVSVFIKKST